MNTMSLEMLYDTKDNYFIVNNIKYLHNIDVCDDTIFITDVFDAQSNIVSPTTRAG